VREAARGFVADAGKVNGGTAVMLANASLQEDTRICQLVGARSTAPWRIGRVASWTLAFATATIPYFPFAFARGPHQPGR
jgi:hypothetical protein